MTINSADSDSDGIPDSWTQQYFGHATGQAADQSRALDDADGDGMKNLLEFALGLDPLKSSTTNAPTVTVENGYLTMTVNRNPNAANLQFVVQVSGDLNTWYSDAAHVTVLQDTSTLLKARDNTPFSAAFSRYLRLGVTNP